jgi:hypothetical protein
MISNPAMTPPTIALVESDCFVDDGNNVGVLDGVADAESELLLVLLPLDVETAFALKTTKESNQTVPSPG